MTGTIALAFALQLAAFDAPPPRDAATVPSPRAGLWVAYDVGGGHSSLTPIPGSGGRASLMQSGGGSRIFQMRVLPVPRRGAATAEIAAAPGYDDLALSVGEIPPGRSRQPDDYQARCARPVRIVMRGNRVRTAPGRSAARGPSCTGPEARMPAAQARPGLPIEAASLLLRLLQLPLPPRAGTSWSQLERHIEENREPGERPRQSTWRSEQFRLAGREVGLSVDLMTDSASVPARICRSVALHRPPPRLTRDECRIEAVLDRRDGWPIAISVAREVEAADRASVSGSISFSRLTPLQGGAAQTR